MGKRQTFHCYECDEEHGLRMLSVYSMNTAGTRSAVEAVALLPAHDLICKDCDVSDLGPATRLHTSEYAKWSVSGVTIDQPTRDWMSQNF